MKHVSGRWVTEDTDVCQDEHRDDWSGDTETKWVICGKPIASELVGCELSLCQEHAREYFDNH